jgi:AraC-like DNA-binding protein
MLGRRVRNWNFAPDIFVRLALDLPMANLNRSKIGDALAAALLRGLPARRDALDTPRGGRRRHKNIIDRFKDILAAHSDRPQRIAEICAALGVSERTLRACSSEILGVSAGRYMRMRRLHLVRAALCRCDPATPTVASVARRYGFTELGRFAVEYRTMFGEKPSETLRRPRSLRKKIKADAS